MRKKHPQLVWELVSHPDAAQRVAQAFDLLLDPLFQVASEQGTDTFLSNTREGVMGYAEGK